MLGLFDARKEFLASRTIRREEVVVSDDDGGNCNMSNNANDSKIVEPALIKTQEPDGLDDDDDSGLAATSDKPAVQSENDQGTT